ncbi:hypothetical protein DL771_002580 [Monosporascus sp. 5C6A]|nr:hypothetical protein DL771_002580 [Monosporascus sp. 5C6A]
MDRLSSEIIHIIASLLSVDDLLNFRLVSRSFADVGAGYLLPEVTFQAHEEELERLRAISLHPIFSRNVKSLIYIGDIRFPPSPFFNFVRDYERTREYYYPSPDLSLSQLETGYKQYEAAASNQRRVLTSRLDVACLEEVLPRLTSLRMVTMSDNCRFHKGRHAKPRPTPFNRTFDVLGPGLTDRPFGRPLDAFLLANASARCNIEHLRAGTLPWKFFDKDPAELKLIFSPFSNLRGIELYMDIIPEEHTRAGTWSELRRFRESMTKGTIRDLLSSMADLQVMSVNVECFHEIEETEDFYAVAPLSHWIQPAYRWQDLQKLVLSGIECPRQELMSMLELHRETLREVCLRDVDLKQTSWDKLLPWIRKTLYLHDACICGVLLGSSETDIIPGGPSRIREHYDVPGDESGRTKFGYSINMYCRRGGECYPDELPVDHTIIEKHYDRYVANIFPRPVDDRLPLLAGGGIYREEFWEDVENSDNNDDDSENGFSDNDSGQ